MRPFENIAVKVDFLIVAREQVAQFVSERKSLPCGVQMLLSLHRSFESLYEDCALRPKKPPTPSATMPAPATTTAATRCDAPGLTPTLCPP